MPGTDVHVVVVPDPLKAVAQFDLSPACTYYDGADVVNFFPLRTKHVREPWSVMPSKCAEVN